MVTIKAFSSDKKQIEDLDITLNITMKLSEWLMIKKAIPYELCGPPDKLRTAIGHVVNEYYKDLSRNFDFKETK